ncbi:MAG TPA: hypothetical protein VN851_06835 [Thermoanaerobaculia bacterium]|nr:hypothetical protein [Thermoanaerobaculia bacterium]
MIKGTFDLKSATSIWRRLEVAVLCCLIIVAISIMFGCYRPTTDASGRWQCVGLFISVYDDGVASYAGERATWRSIGPDAIRLEFQEDGAPKVAEFTMLKKAGDKIRRATLNVGGLEINCIELPPK